jgi:hypothetical protein
VSPVVLIPATLAYILFGGLLLRLGAYLVPQSRAMTEVIGFSWVFGWIWLVGALAARSARVGWLLLRCWIGFVGGVLLAIGPFALLPHPATIVAGVALGVAWGSWCIMGKAHWLWRD